MTERFYSGRLQPSELNIWDVSNPDAPAITHSVAWTSGSQTQSVQLTDDDQYACVLDPEDKLFGIIDVSDPAAATEVGLFDNPPNFGGYWDLRIGGDYAFVCDRGDTAGSLTVGSFDSIDISDKTNPSLADSLSGYIEIRDVRLDGDYAYYIEQDRNDDTYGGVYSANVSDPTNMTELDFLQTSALADSRFLGLKDNHVFVCGRANNNFISVDISDPNNLSQTQNLTDSRLEKSHGIAIIGNYAYVTCSSPNGMLLEIDISDPSNMEITADENIPDVADIVTDGSLLYVWQRQDDELHIIEPPTRHF